MLSSERSPSVSVSFLRSTPFFPGRHNISQPLFSRADFFSFSLQQAIIVGISFAVWTMLQSSGMRSLLSQIILTGFLPPGIRDVKSGLSARTVPIPARMQE